LIGAPYWQALTGRARAGVAGPAQAGLAGARLTGVAGVAGLVAGLAQAGLACAEPGRADGSTAQASADDRLRLRPGDASLIDRCGGPTLDVGSGPGRLTVALAERGVPALGIDVTTEAVDLARSAGALALRRDVFSRLPGTGRWMFVLLAEGSIGIGGDPVALLSRVAELLAPAGRAIVEVRPPGHDPRGERVSPGHGKQAGDWFPCMQVGADQLAGIAGEAGLSKAETWCADGRWFVTLRKARG
jgi:SAM-dependent methyltransferase